MQLTPPNTHATHRFQKDPHWGAVSPRGISTCNLIIKKILLFDKASNNNLLLYCLNIVKF